MGVFSSSSALMVLMASPQVTMPSYFLIYQDKVIDSASVGKLQSIKKADDLAQFASRLDLHIVELKPGYSAILPNHSKLNKYLSIREKLFGLYLASGVGRHETDLDSLLRLDNLDDPIRTLLKSSFREMGVVLEKDSCFAPSVTLDLVLTKDNARVTVPYAHPRQLSSRADALLKSVSSFYDPSKVADIGKSDYEAIDSRANVELSLNSLRVATWGGIRTNGRAANFGELAFKQLSNEFSDIEQRAIRMNTQFLTELSIQGSSWKSIMSSIGNPILGAGGEVTSSLEGSIYGDATRLGLTDRKSVKDFLSKAKLESVHVSIGADTWVKFQDGSVGRFGIEL